jgi:hypothetical protein
MPRPSSTGAPTESPISGVTAVYERVVPKSERSSSAYTRRNAPSSQSNPPQASAVRARSGRRIAWKSARSSDESEPAWPRAKIAAAGSRRNSSIAIRASSRLASQ